MIGRLREICRALLSDDRWRCPTCGSLIPRANGVFCPECGTNAARAGDETDEDSDEQGQRSESGGERP